jgi:SAM-dependent methyltransferase
MSFLSLSGSFDYTIAGDGPVEMASSGLHASLEKLLHEAASGGTLDCLDLGSGTGAWGIRLRAGGHRVRGVHLEPETCAIESVQADLNLPFAHRFNDRFDVITCIEVLEHLENPRNAFREARKLLKEDGVLLISVPNASGCYSRLKFFVTGRFCMFDDHQYEDIGHITPLTHWQLSKMFEEAGLEVVGTADHDATAKRPKTLGDFVKWAARLLRPLMRGHVGTQHLIMIGRPKPV